MRQASKTDFQDIYAILLERGYCCRTRVFVYPQPVNYFRSIKHDTRKVVNHLYSHLELDVFLQNAISLYIHKNIQLKFLDNFELQATYELSSLIHKAAWTFSFNRFI